MSSSKKKLVVQCRHCGCHILSKDMEAHVGGYSGAPDTPTGSQDESGQSAGRGGGGGRRRTRQSAGKNGPCTGGNGFSRSRIAMIEPGRGMALRPHSFGEDQSTKWEQQQSFGWQRRHSALIHPEGLANLGVLPRSAVLLLVEPAADVREGKDDHSVLLTLWPNAEVPHLRIVLPPTISASHPSSLLLRLALVHPHPSTIAKLCFRPNVDRTELPTHFWTRLADLAHFPLFLRAYFANAVICPSKEVEMSYYGNRLVFGVSSFEIEEEQVLEQKMKLVKLDENYDGDEQGRHLLEQKMGVITLDEQDDEKSTGEVFAYYVGPLCQFSVDWNDFLTEATMEDEMENLR